MCERRSSKNDIIFSVDAFVPLPDHLNCLCTLPDGDWDFPKTLAVDCASFELRVSRSKCKKVNSKGRIGELNEISRLMLRWETSCVYCIDLNAEWAMI